MKVADALAAVLPGQNDIAQQDVIARIDVYDIPRTKRIGSR